MHTFIDIEIYFITNLEREIISQELASSAFIVDEHASAFFAEQPLKMLGSIVLYRVKCLVNAPIPLIRIFVQREMIIDHFMIFV